MIRASAFAMRYLPVHASRVTFRTLLVPLVNQPTCMHACSGCGMAVHGWMHLAVVRPLAPGGLQTIVQGCVMEEVWPRVKATNVLQTVET